MFIMYLKSDGSKVSKGFFFRINHFKYILSTCIFGSLIVN